MTHLTPARFGPRPLLLTMESLLRAATADGPCIEWPRYRTKEGYGVAWFGGKRAVAHRHAYEFDGVGHIKRASGTSNRATFKEIDAMLTAFASQSRHDLLESIRDGKLRAVYALTWFKQSRLDKIPTADVLPPLASTWDTWFKKLAVSPDHAKSIAKTRKYLNILPAHILNDTLALLSAYLLKAAAKPFVANQARVHVQAFLRDTLGAHHRLWSLVSDLTPPKKVKGAPRDQLSPDEVRRLVVQLGPEAGECAWAMAAYGMLPKEYWTNGYEEHPDRVRIRGSKRESRDRIVPRWTTIGGPRIGRDAFRIRLSKATAKKVRPTDFRRAFARWMEEAGILESHRKNYMGHKARTMTQLYTFGEMVGQMEEDAKKLRAYTGEPDLTPTLKVEVA